MMYYMMHIDFAAPLLADNPKAAVYDNDTLVLTGDIPVGFTGEVVDLSALGFNEFEDPSQTGLTPTQFVSMVDTMRNAEPTGKLIIASKTQGKYLYYNHSAFMQVSTDGS
jgi:hypothetical protein|tara:strand:+ start:357 stop:686 length:330 start_codon:yes stop_codon:yes gene_type:complete